MSLTFLPKYPGMNKENLYALGKAVAMSSENQTYRAQLPLKVYKIRSIQIANHSA